MHFFQFLYAHINQHINKSTSVKTKITIFPSTPTKKKLALERYDEKIVL